MPEHRFGDMIQSHKPDKEPEKKEEAPKSSEKKHDTERIHGDAHNRERMRLEKEYEEADIPAWKARTKINRALDDKKEEFEKGKKD